ncbi:transmembrane protein 248 [Galendromus occidentalis]|uniref:Transmembrane protein 248 n=1 Tax=Galendromus occidentalis TaxID=34638 RepID=A0AAJ6VZQ9_9ACAR|nr:transmembrane protein 248 [Galendromus occidentalis]
MNKKRRINATMVSSLLSPWISSIKVVLGLQPPVLLFTFCLLAFGICMLSMSTDLENRTLPNPDVVLDWNEFMSRLSRLHYCVMPPTRSAAPVAAPSKNASTTGDQPKVQVVDEGKSLAALLPDFDLHLGRAKNGSPPHPKANVTVAVSIRAAFHEDILSEPMSWHAVATGDMVGCRGPLARENFQLVMLLWPVRPGSQDRIDPLSPGMVNTEACIIIQGPTEILPKTRAPSRCYLNALPPQVTREIKLQRTAADVQGKKGDICTLGRWTSFTYKPDAALQVLLSRADLLLVKERLRRCGIFLIAISILIILGAVLSSHSSPRRYMPHFVYRAPHS